MIRWILISLFIGLISFAAGYLKTRNRYLGRFPKCGNFKAKKDWYRGIAKCYKHESIFEFDLFR